MIIFLLNLKMRTCGGQNLRKVEIQRIFLLFWKHFEEIRLIFPPLSVVP